MHGLSRRTLEALGRALVPSLRGITLAYTGLAGMLAMVLVVAVALTPVAPTLQQATEPARQVVVTNLVQPTGDAIVNLLGSQPAPPQPATPAFSSATTIDVTITDAPLEQPTEQPTEEAPPEDVATAA